MDIYVGDKVQIKNGGIDVTNGNTATAGIMYGENGPLWAEVIMIDKDWNTGSRYGLEKTVTRVRCSNKGVIVWQVRPEDIAPNIIRASEPEIVQRTAPEPKKSIPPTDQGSDDLSSSNLTKANVKIEYKSDYKSNTVNIETTSFEGYEIDVVPPSTKHISKNAFASSGEMYYENQGTGTTRDLSLKEKRNIGGADIIIDDNVQKLKQRTVWEDNNRRNQLLNRDESLIQNDHGYPIKVNNGNSLMSAKYNYQIIPGNPKLAHMITLEDKLQQARQELGLQVHGNNNIARAVKYYMYNRFKTPDINLAHNKSVTYVFFTRPDLNILTGNTTTPYANSQTINHSESSFIWQRNPELFKLLTDCKRCGDSDNFNMLLSNQVSSFDIRDEEISSVRAGMSWTEYEMVYGDAYTGRTAGEFSCNFTELADYSVIHLIKLWITYIDNVARGVWSPSYNLTGSGYEMVGKNANGVPDVNMSHVYSKTLDYASSVYVFKCGPDGEDVLYWSKYYGVFPTNTGANALTWDNNTPIGTDLKLNIKFNYSFKKDLSPISLIEFNRISGIQNGDTVIAQSAFNTEYGNSSRPYVGAPFIQFNINPELTLKSDSVNWNRTNSSIKLKFKKASGQSPEDKLLYRSSLDGNY